MGNILKQPDDGMEGGEEADEWNMMLYIMYGRRRGSVSCYDHAAASNVMRCDK